MYDVEVNSNMHLTLKWKRFKSQTKIEMGRTPYFMSIYIDHPGIMIAN